MITAGIINGIWNYYLSLEKDLDDTSRYIEPKGQENVFSFEFAKLLVLSCTELESVLKLLCYECSGEKRGNIGEYKETILTYYPKIVFAEVNVSRWGETIRPFDGWDKGKLSWWDAYGNVKHNREDNFRDATYQNVVYALSALYVSIFYLSSISGVSFSGYASTYIESDYSSHGVAVSPNKKLPDLDPNFTESTENSSAARSVRGQGKSRGTDFPYRSCRCCQSRGEEAQGQTVPQGPAEKALHPSAAKSCTRGTGKKETGAGKIAGIGGVTDAEV